jgi:hypothetical protein
VWSAKRHPFVVLCAVVVLDGALSPGKTHEVSMSPEQNAPVPTNRPHGDQQLQRSLPPSRRRRPCDVISHRGLTRLPGLTGRAVAVQFDVNVVVVILLIPSKHDASLGFAEPLPVSEDNPLDLIDAAIVDAPVEKPGRPISCRQNRCSRGRRPLRGLHNGRRRSPGPARCRCGSWRWGNRWASRASAREEGGGRARQ